MSDLTPSRTGSRTAPMPTPVKRKPTPDVEANEYDCTDPFVNDGAFETCEMQLGLRHNETIEPVRKRRRTLRYVPVEQVCNSDAEFASDTESESDTDSDAEWLPVE